MARRCHSSPATRTRWSTAARRTSALNRIPDAQQAYLDLYAGNRTLAGKLLTAMKSWVAEQRASPAGGKAANLDDLDKWIQERAQIAGQTAALTRAGTAASWR